MRNSWRTVKKPVRQSEIVDPNLKPEVEEASADSDKEETEEKNNGRNNNTSVNV